MEYLPTFAQRKSPSFVGKYTSTMVRIYTMPPMISRISPLLLGGSDVPKSWDVNVLQQMEVRKRTICLAIEIVGIFREI